MLHTWIRWEYLPQRPGFRSDRTYRLRLAAWNEAGVRDRLHVLLLARVRAARPVVGGDRLLPRPGRSASLGSGPSPVDRARPGSKHHVLVDGQRIPRRGRWRQGLSGRYRQYCHVRVHRRPNARRPVRSRHTPAPLTADTCIG
ncbi:hypothetical protein [Streptomyces pratensis]|uniref:hypothetical protein n=1 Tax=Streptomyces pratensis TaxID=1169025 RepID=UPI0036286E9A